jgi:large subunit ribosomal protein LP2
MKHLAAYLLLTLGGNESPKAKDIKAVLESVGIEADDDRLSSLLSELKGKDINTVRAIFSCRFPGTHAYYLVVDL